MTRPVLPRNPLLTPEPTQTPETESGKGRTWRDWYLVAILVGFVGYCFGPGLVGQRVLLEVNYLTTRYPWAVTGNQQIGRESLATDPLDTWVPSIAYIRQAIFSGHLPNWQGLVAGGTPIGSLPDSAQLSPLSLPFWVLPLWLAPAFVILLTFVVAVGGTFLFLRRLRVGRAGSLVAGLVFATSGFMVMWTNWPQVRVACLIPALLWAAERLIQRERSLDVVLLAAVIVSMIFGGFPVVTGWALYLAVGYFLFRMGQRYRFSLRAWLKPTGLAAGGLVLGGLLSMVQLLPFVSFYDQHGFAYRDPLATQGLPVSSLITALAPNAYGLGLSGAPYHGPANAIEVVAYVGAAAVVLAVAGAALGARRRHRNSLDSREQEGSAQEGIVGYFLLATVVILAVGWGPTAIRDVTQHLPVFSGNFVGRIRSVLGFTVAVLAGFGFDRLTLRFTPAIDDGHAGVDQPARARGESSFLPTGWEEWVWVLSALALLFVLWRAIRTAVFDHYLHDFAHATWIPIVFLVAALVLVVASRLRPRQGTTTLFVVLPILVAAQGAQFFHTVLPNDSRQNFYPVTGAHRFLKANLGHDRFSSSGGTMYPTTGLYYGLRTPTGHAFQDPNWDALLQAIDPRVQLSPTFTDFSSSINQTNIGNQPILDQMGVKYFVLTPGGVTGTTKPLVPANGSTHIGAQTDATCTVPGEPLRGVQFPLASVFAPSNSAKGATMKVTVRDGGRVVSSGLFTNAVVPAGDVFTVGLAGEDLPRAGTATVTISETGSAGVSLGTHDGRVICSPVTPAADHLKLVYADSGSVIYQRLTALPRIHWTSHTTVVPQLDDQIAALEHGIAPNDVILASRDGSSSGQPATVHVDQDAYNTIRATVDAQGAGHLVIADALQQPGWSATLDGKPTTLLPANGAMVAVAAPQGTHVITLRYHAPGQKAGAAISAVALIVALTLLGWEWRRRGRRRAALEVDDAQK